MVASLSALKPQPAKKWNILPLDTKVIIIIIVVIIITIIIIIIGPGRPSAGRA